MPGATSNDYLTFEVISGGRLLANDLWYEGPNASTFAHVADNSIFTVDNCRMALPQNGYSVRIDNLSGKASILNCQPDAPVGVLGTGNGTAWVAGNESSWRQQLLQRHGGIDNRGVQRQPLVRHQLRFTLGA